MKKATRKYSQGIMPLGVVTIIGVKKNISHLQIIEKKIYLCICILFTNNPQYLLYN